jgi:hypothetical protein
MASETEEKKIEGEKEVEKTGQKVELEQETYNALLDRVAELEAEGATRKRGGGDETLDLESLAEEGKGKRVIKEQREKINFDEMNNEQLAQFIIDIVNEQGGARVNEIAVAVETLKVTSEIDRCERKHEDFWSYDKQIRQIAINNPSLSIEDAYFLAKSKSPAKKEKKEGEEEKEPTTRTEKLLKLPPRTHGERPGVAVGSTAEKAGKMTTREAALKAWDENVGKGKTQIE